MLSKCANPTCRSLFRYLHEGKLYVIGPKEALATHKPRCAAKSGQIEYAWLCSSCCLHLTIQIDEEIGTRVVRKFELRARASSGKPADASINGNSAPNRI
jgi:hypothetical protein